MLNGYYSYGNNDMAGSNPGYRSFVSVETLSYSLAQNHLVWAARSKTTSPAAATAERLSQVAVLAN